MSSGPRKEHTPSSDFAGEDDRLRRAVDGQRRSRAEEDPESDRGSGLASNSQ